MEQKKTLTLDGKAVTLTEAQDAQLRSLLAKEPVELATLHPGNTFMVGNHEMVVLEHFVDGGTAAIRRELLRESMQFGSSNNYDGSDVDKVCCKFAEELAALVGEENLLEHEVDLTSDDGLKDYGVVKRKASLLTCDRYRRWVETLDLHKIDSWQWLATPYTTPSHENDRWGKCVAPSGLIGLDVCDYDDYGVRPFCIFKSSIFGSSES